MSKLSCGIDFGTSNSAISIVEANQNPRLISFADNNTIPTAIFYPSSQGLHPLFGKSAVNAYINAEKGRFMRSMKRILGSDLMTGSTKINGIFIRFPEIISSFINYLKKQAELQTETNIENVIMGRPVRFRENDDAGDKQAQNELTQIARSIGFKNIGFQFEPIAAAYAHEAKINNEKLALVIDIGGGTSDFTVIKIGPQLMSKLDRSDDILANSGIRIGGNDFDKDLCLKSFMPEFGFGGLSGGQSQHDKILPLSTIPYFTLAEWSKVNSMYTPKEINFVKKMLYSTQEPTKVSRLLELVEDETGHTLLAAVEEAKIELTTNNNISKILNFISDKPQINISKTEFEISINNNINRISTIIEECLKQAQTNASQINMIILTGGSTEIPAVKKAVLHHFPDAELSQDNKMSSVGLGLAYDSLRRFR